MGAKHAGGRKLRFVIIPLLLLLLCFVGCWGKLFTKVEIFGVAAKQVFVKFCRLQQFGLDPEVSLGLQTIALHQDSLHYNEKPDGGLERLKAGGWAIEFQVGF